MNVAFYGLPLHSYTYNCCVYFQFSNLIIMPFSILYCKYSFKKNVSKKNLTTYLLPPEDRNLQYHDGVYQSETLN